MSNLETDISAARVKDAKLERLPELSVRGSVEKASNIPVYENGLFSKPTQHEVIHTLYRAGADFYFNIYNGNKLNLKIKQEKFCRRLKRSEKMRVFPTFITKQLHCILISKKFDVPEAYKRGYP